MLSQIELDTILTSNRYPGAMLTREQSQAAYDRGDDDALLADEYRAYLALDDDELSGYGLQRATLLARLESLNK